ncbi:MAG: hypothetical protein KAX84_17280 [Burkholderiales bacterium]|nr:hypothetical protein [Burkholderiales bacterium]
MSTICGPAFAFCRRFLRPLAQAAAGALIAGGLLSGQVVAAAADKVTVEFYLEDLDHYFMTADPAEAAAIDGGAAGPWDRTGQSWGAWSTPAIAPAGSVPVCRFYGSISPGPNSHFYTASAAECEQLKQLQAGTPASQKRWNYEGIAFYAPLPVNGQCTGGLVPLYRAYNDGFAQGIDSNHRFGIDLSLADGMREAGWIGEGAVMCVEKLVTAAAGGVRKVIASEGVPREFWVYLPSDYSADRKYPVVVMHHGTSGNGEKFLNISGWRERAELSKFIAVFPTARVNCFYKDGLKHSTTKWNSGSDDFVLCDPAIAKNDVLFFRNLIDHLKANYAVDDDRIYSAGFSNGGQMSLRLAMEASDLIAAATFCSGTHQVTGTPVELIPTWFAVGEQDDRFMPLNNNQPLPMNSTLFDLPYFRASTNAILTAMQIGTDRVDNTTGTTYTAHLGTLLNGGPSREHNVSVIKGLTHLYANGVNNPVVYADVFWNFYSQYHK